MGVGSGLYMYDVVVKKVQFTLAISSPDEFLHITDWHRLCTRENYVCLS